MKRSLERRIARLEGANAKSEKLEIKIVVIEPDFNRGLYAYAATHDRSTGVTTEIPEEEKVWRVPIPHEMGALYARHHEINHSLTPEKIRDEERHGTDR